MIYDDLFHIHTKRCKHASNIKDSDFVDVALQLNSKSIFFIDHAPFPNNIFGNRMDMEDLNEYITSMRKLQCIYNGQIEIKYGLEIEYIPKYMDYYKFLNEELRLPLYLGQHICEWTGKYNFEYADKKEEYLWFTESIIEAIDSNLFSGILHPDRVYKNIKSWKDIHNENSKLLWNVFRKNNIPVEFNYSSDVIKRDYFWQYKQSNNILYGLDAHNLETLKEGTLFFRSMNL